MHGGYNYNTTAKDLISILVKGANNGRQNRSVKGPSDV
jgi:hypothetical protein